MNHEELIRNLGETAGIGLELSPMGTAAAVFDGDEVDFESAGGRLYVYADIASADGREADFAALLAANHLCLHTDGAAAGLDLERKMFTLCRVLDGDVEYAAFEQAVAVFLDALRSLKQMLAEESVPSADEPSGGAPPAEGAIMV